MAKDYTTTREARYPGTCGACKKPIAVGEKIARKENANGWKARRWNHAACELTWLCDGKVIPGSQGVALYVAFNALGERVGDNAAGILEGIATYAPEGTSRMRARDGMRELGILGDSPAS